jgi:hypothetical protein
MSGPREDEVRERMNRDADILRGLGQMPSLDDMRTYADELSWAAVEDGMRYEEEWAAEQREWQAEVRAEHLAEVKKEWDLHSRDRG